MNVRRTKITRSGSMSSGIDRPCRKKGERCQPASSREADWSPFQLLPCRRRSRDQRKFGCRRQTRHTPCRSCLSELSQPLKLDTQSFQRDRRAFHYAYVPRRGPPFCDPMDLFWQINPEEMFSGLMVTTFLILLDASIVVVASMVMFPLIDLAFKKKAKPAPAQVEPWHPGPPWLALRSNFLRPDAVSHFQLDGLSHRPDPPLEHITHLITRSLVPKGSEGAPPGPVMAPPTPLTSNRKAA